MPQALAVCRASADAAIPDWVLTGELYSVTRTPEELSIVCAETCIPQDAQTVKVERGWVALKLEGPFPFAMTGVLASFLDPLAEAKIPIFAVSTFDTDYVLIKAENLQAAEKALGAAGHECV